MDTCSHCGVALPEKATFCPACGRRTDAPPPDPAVLPIVLRPEEPSLSVQVTRFVRSPTFVLALAFGLLVPGIVLTILGPRLPGVLAILLTLGLLGGLLLRAQRLPAAALARTSRSTLQRVRGEAGAAGESISTWSRTSRDLVRHRRRQFQLRRERDAKIRELGLSAYAGDGRADELKAAAKELDSQIEANEQTMQRTLAAARKRVRSERAAVVATEVITPAAPADEDEAPKPRD